MEEVHSVKRIRNEDDAPTLSELSAFIKAFEHTFLQTYLDAVAAFPVEHLVFEHLAQLGRDFAANVRNPTRNSSELKEEHLMVIEWQLQRMTNDINGIQSMIQVLLEK